LGARYRGSNAATDAQILTWLDDYSRYALSLTAHRQVTGRVVLDTFRATVAADGIPASTLTYNGMVFTTRLAGGKAAATEPGTVQSRDQLEPTRSAERWRPRPPFQVEESDVQAGVRRQVPEGEYRLMRKAFWRHGHGLSSASRLPLSGSIPTQSGQG
jgi:hypothetical protein